MKTKFFSSRKPRTSVNAGQREEKMAKLSDYIVKVCLYALVFLLPIFYLPFTSDVLQFNKQNLLIVLSLIAFIAWLGKIIFQRRIEILKSPLNIAVLIFVAIYGISSYLSLDRYKSFVGNLSDLSSNFITVLCFVFILFVAINNIKKSSEIVNMLITLCASAFLVAIHTLLQLFNVYIFTEAVTNNINFNLIGTVNSLGIFYAVILTVCVGLLLISTLYGQKLNLPIKIGLVILGIISLFIVGMVNYWAIWLLLIVSMVCFLAFATLRVTDFNDKLLMLPMLILIFSIFFTFLRFPINPQFATEILPSSSTSWKITKSVLQSHPLFGSGPGTFPIDYLQFKPVEINNTSFWSTTFLKSRSDMMDVAITTGTLGFASFIIVIGIFLFVVFDDLIRNKTDEKWGLSLVLLSSSLVIILAKVLYDTNLVLNFLFWLIMGMALSLIIQRALGGEKSMASGKVTSLSLETSPRVSVIMSFAFILLAVFIISFLYLVGQRYAADVYYKAALKSSQINRQLSAEELEDNFNQVTSLLVTSGRLNKFEDLYLRELSKVFLLRLDKELASESTEESIRKAQIFIQNSNETAKRASEISPNVVDNYVALGQAYEKVIPYVQNADVWTLESYKKALELDPNNAELLTKLGELYMSFGDIAAANEAQLKQTQGADQNAIADFTAKRTENYNNAQTYFEKAVQAKSDYAFAHYNLALVYSKVGKTDEAVEKMETVLRNFPRDVGVMLQLSMMYFAQGNVDKSKAALETAIRIAPNYANAYWYLASIYESEGDTDKAIEYLEKILEFSPDEKIVQQKIDYLRQGNAAEIPPLPQPVSQPSIEVEEPDIIEGVNTSEDNNNQ